MGRRTCSMESRSRTVTQPSAGVLSSPTVSKSTVMQYGVSNIARLRASANVSQTSFALMVGVSRKYLIDIESGKANPTVDMLERIAGGLDTTVGQLFEGL